MKPSPSLLSVFCAISMLAQALTASARTVYDAGAALHANITSGSPVGTNGVTYTDAQGGKWQYLRANDALATSTTAFGKSVTSGMYYQGIGGNSSVSGSPYIHVNVSGAATMDSVSGGTAVDKDELYIHPGNPDNGNHYCVVRFTVPEAGWYSAFVTAHDLNGDGNVNAQAGAEVRLLANNVLQARGVVTLENYKATSNDGNTSLESHLVTHRFDFQMPVRWMAANETIDFMVGANGAHNSDATGLKAFVTKEDEGAFYDSGLALASNIAGSNLNPFGTADLGMWYYCYADTLVPKNNSGSQTSAPPDAFAAWAPGQLTKKLNRLVEPCIRTAALHGFAMTTNGTSPCTCLNYTSANSSEVAPNEIFTHPTASSWSEWTALRFRPTRSGLYSASIVIRDVTRNVINVSGSDGVVAYLLVAEKMVTNAVVSAETWDATAHFTFAPRLIVANEPVDILVSPLNGHNDDGTTISAIFRREADVCDAGPSMAALNWAGASLPTTPAHPFADLLGGGATWDVGSSTVASGTPFTTMPKAFRRVSNSVDYFGFGQTYAGNVTSDGGLPRVMLATNSVANLMDANDDKIFRIAPNEIWMHPNSSQYPVIHAKVPSDGVYHARAYGRDVANGNDGIRFRLGVGGVVPALARISLEKAEGAYEAALDGPRLWLKAGETVDAVVDPNTSDISFDGTGVGFCYVKEGEATARVVNVHFTERVNGKFSQTSQRPREGWANWNKWNAFTAGDAATASLAGCYEADGETRRNVTVTLARDSGAAIAKGSTNDALFYSFVSSTGTADTYTFTISQLAKNAPYTLYLYSVKSTSELGNAAFTIGGVTKGVEEPWDVYGRKTLTRFDATSDANGVITGTFAASSASGGVFNGLSVVGDFPDYKSSAFTLVVR